MSRKRNRPPKAYRNIEFLTSSRARPIRILAEFLEPYHRFQDMHIESTIVFFGSARIQAKSKAKARLKELAKICETDPSQKNMAALSAARLQLRLSNYYEEAAKLAQLLTEWSMDKETGNQKYYICSGGGPGIMEAANKGAYKAKGKSIGLNISIPHEQFPNSYITEELMFEFHYFFMRKYWFVYLAKALVIFPGGFGTLDELMEVLTLIQTKKLTKPLPIIVFGQDYWQEVIDIEAMAKWGTISRDDLKLFKVVNTAEEAFHHLKEVLQ
ncbi:MAG TPA: TIGR00730 family Rossman fold protein [Calditrichaeota bacterium]|nr:TIGR00730 family Rossman fold protein [Calditrichota bacterium]